MRRLWIDFVIVLISGVFFSVLVEMSTIREVATIIFLVGLVWFLTGLPSGNSTSDFRTKYRPG